MGLHGVASEPECQKEVPLRAIGLTFGCSLGGPFVALGPHNPANAASWEVFFQDVFSALFCEAEGLPLQWSDVAHMLYIVYGLHIALFWA